MFSFNGLSVPRPGTRQRYISTVAVPLLVLVLLSACAQPTATRTGVPTATAPAPGGDALPAFADWRAAYLGEDGRIHAVSLDGKQDSPGQLLPGLTSPSLDFVSAGISPDGQTLAYNSYGLEIVHLAGAEAPSQVNRVVGSAAAWSADGSKVAIDERRGSILIANTRSSDPPQLVQGTPPNAVGDLIGWIDGAHLAVTYSGGQSLVSNPNNSQDQYATSIAVASLSIRTGKTHVIATIHSPGLGQWTFSLAPDGRKILFSNRRYRSYPYTPLVDEIDVASGTVTPLPRIDHITQSGFTAIAWQRGTNAVAVSSGFIVNGDLKNWLLDLNQDTAQSLPNSGYVAGWAPSSRALVLTTGQQVENGTGPFTLTVVVVGVSGQVTSSTVLTTAAMTFPFLGFVRTG